MVARPSARVVVICGDGAFQMTGMELSTIVRHKLSPVIIVLDNCGYGTERILHPGDFAFNEIHGWQYAELPGVLRGGKGYRVQTERQFDCAITEAWQDRTQMHLIHVHLDRDDCSQSLARLAERLGQRV